jgi:mycothiol S-conjugate amidase
MTPIPASLPSLAPFGITSDWLRPIAASRRLLFVFAHPDDESFSNAGTILRAVAAGAAVHYACATRGECGSVDPALLTGVSSTAALRTAELSCAARALGLAAVHYLGWRDSGMAGAPDNTHPDALAQAPPTRVAAQVAAIIRAVRPQTVVTFNPYGGYGHPDHIAIHRATRAAFTAAGDPAYAPEHLAAGLAPYQPARLYYTTFDPRPLRLSIAAMRLLRRDPRRLGRNADMDLLRIAEAVTPTTTVIDTRPWLADAAAARRCHRSQYDPSRGLERLPRFLQRWLTGAERFTRVHPPWSPGAPLETDLFDETMDAWR